MAASKELLTEIMEGISAVQLFLNKDLGQESLTPGCQVQRQNISKLLQNVINKIQCANPSIRPPTNTLKKPPPPPPMDNSTLIPEDTGEELYEDPTPDQPEQKVEDYLDFQPSPLNGGTGEEADQEQEMYEAMEGGGQQDVYEEPVISTTMDLQEDNAETYEEPLSRPSTASLQPNSSQENSGSGAEYAETTRIGREQDKSIEMSTADWGTVYMPPKNEKKKVSSLKNVLIKGFLEKLGGKSQKNWQRRYCVLAGTLMYFYEKENSKSYNNCIAIQLFNGSPAPNMTNEKKKQFAFKLTQLDSQTGKNKDYYFRANSSDIREKWLSCISRVACSSPLPQKLSASTLPRMPSQISPTGMSEDNRKKRATSFGGAGEEEGELYEDMAIPEEGEEDQDEYVAVAPGEQEGKFESSEEYVDVVKQDEIDQEEYEDTTNFQQPPPPLSPPPGPPSKVFSPPQAPLPKSPAPRPHSDLGPVVDTSRVYTQPSTNGIHLEKVFVSMWDFAAGEEDELNLRRGDLVYVNSPRNSDEWWFGELLDHDAARKLGPTGFFPRNYSTQAFEAVTA